jgi:type II secretory pathway predicted ATPase ExeA
MASSNTPASPEQLQRYIKAAEIFTPSAPINSQELFSGRSEQIMQVISAIAQKGQHAIIYGERGVGKTSLAKVAANIMRQGDSNIQATIINCDGIDDFTSLWQKIFRELDPLQKHPQLATADITPEAIRYWLQQQSGKTMIAIDEMDRLGPDQLATRLLADTIKTLSDHSLDTTLILVGVANSVHQLIAEHASIERCLVQVRMPRMSPAESIDLLEKRFVPLQLTVPPVIVQQIAFLSQGFPSYTHLLALVASQQAISQNSQAITPADLDWAVASAVKKSYESIINTYHQATASSRPTIYAQVLLACALATKDELGSFKPKDVVPALSLITNKAYSTTGFARHLNDFCTEQRAAILAKTGSRFRFTNPMMQPYVIMHGLANGLIQTTHLEQWIITDNQPE